MGMNGNGQNQPMGMNGNGQYGMRAPASWNQ